MNHFTQFNRQTRAAFIHTGTSWLLLCVGAGAALIGKGLLTPPASKIAPSPANRRLTQARSQWKHKAIEQVCVGQRVATPQTATGVAMETAVDPATWKLLSLVIDYPANDGTPKDVAEIQTLQPQTWIEKNHAMPGAFVPTPLDLREMGMAPAPARVVSIEACPQIKHGAGGVVLTTVNHLNQFLFDLTLVDNAGRRETLGITGWHKLYSASRDDWVSASTVTIGESLEGHIGTVSVESLVRRPGTFRVYNITVEGEHAYYASNLDALSHNINCAEVLAGFRVKSLVEQLAEKPSLQRYALRDALQAAPGQVAHHIIPLEAETKFAGLLEKAAQGGFDINGQVNGILLSAADHVGSHKLYSKAVLDFLKLAPDGLSPKEAADFLKKAADTLRKSIMNGAFLPRM